MGNKVCYREATLSEMRTDIKYIRENLERLVQDNKSNTEFRQKAYGVVAVATILGGIITSAILWVMDKFWK